MPGPTQETDKTLLYRLGRAPILLNFGSAPAAAALSILLMPVSLPLGSIQILGGAVTYAGGAAVVGPITITGLRNGVAIPGTTVVIPAAAPSGTFIAFDATLFTSFELFDGDILGFDVAGDVLNAPGSVVAVVLTGRPL